jgi:hypothetical protein
MFIAAEDGAGEVAGGIGEWVDTRLGRIRTLPITNARFRTPDKHAKKGGVYRHGKCLKCGLAARGSIRDGKPDPI